MFIEVNKIPFYYLNYEGYVDRNIRMIELIKKININGIRVRNDAQDDLRQNRIALGTIKLLEMAISNNVFPFVSMDDDLNLIKDLPSQFYIPSKADLIFLGGSLYNTGGYKPNMYIEDFDEYYYRCYFMLSLHCMIIPNLDIAKFLINSVKESLNNNQFLDMDITMRSKDLVFLTPKQGPYFYQDNYNESVTRFLWNDVKESYLTKYL